MPETTTSTPARTSSAGRAIGWLGRMLGVTAVTLGLAMCFPWLFLAMAGLWIIAMLEGRERPGGWRSSPWGRFPAWYFGPDTAVIRSVAWMTLLLGPALMSVFFLPTLREEMAADPNNPMGPELADLMVFSMLGFMGAMALGVVAHACWQSYRGEREVLSRAVDAEVARVHQLYVDRDITAVNYAVTCQNCGRADIRLFLGHAERCGCGTVLKRTEAVRLAT